MSNLVEYAKDELKRIGMVDSGEHYNDSVTKAIIDLIELFASQDHTGFTAPYTINAFSRLAMFKPLSPLTGEDDEWEYSLCGDDSLQNKRYSAVFKDKDGTAYNIEGKVFTDDGEVWYRNRDSRVDVTFPYVVPDKPEYVYRNKEESEPFINKPCISIGVCEQDKNKVLDKVKAEIEKVFCISVVTDKLRTPMEVKAEILEIIDKYKVESEGGINGTKNIKS